MSNLSDSHRFNRAAAGASMIGSALLLLGASLAWPSIKSDEAAQIAVIVAHPSRYYLATVLILASSMLLVPALIGLMAMAQTRSPKLAHIGGSLSLLGALVAVGDSTTQLVVWQMGAHGADTAQMAALLHRFDNTAGSSLVFTIGGLATLIGVAILAIALYRSRSAPAWACAGIVAGTVLNIAGFSAGSTGILILSGIVLVGSLGWIGWHVLTGQAREPRAPAFKPATIDA